MEMKGKPYKEDNQGVISHIIQARYTLLLVTGVSPM